MKKRLLITGGTGFTGRFVVERFIADPEFDVSILVRDEKKADMLGLVKENIQIYKGSFEDADALARAFQDKDILVNIASLGFGHCASIVGAALDAKIPRALFVSTTAVFTKLNPASKAVRLQAEETIAESGLQYTVVRPTMIVGTRDDRNICRLIKYVKKFPVLPIAGPGKSLVQPVYVKDLAEGIYAIVKKDKFENKSYNLSGKTACTFNELVDLVARLLGKRVLKLHIPLGLMIFLFDWYEKFATNPRIKAEQLIRLNEDKAFSYSDAAQDFGYEPTELEIVLQREIDDIFG